jgi:hypothetical protein
MENLRIYLVGHGQDTRLVRAGHRAQAMNHVAKALITVKVATQNELVDALQKGISVESAVDSDQLTLVE